MANTICWMTPVIMPSPGLGASRPYWLAAGGGTAWAHRRRYPAPTTAHGLRAVVHPAPAVVDYNSLCRIHFPTWSEVVHMPYKRPDIDTDDVIRRYVAGESELSIARSYGANRESIQRRLRKAGVTRRSGSEANLLHGPNDRRRKTRQRRCVQRCGQEPSCE